MTRDRRHFKSALQPRLFHYASAVYQLLTSRDYRSRLMLRLRQPRNLFQVCNWTSSDRYPCLFRLARETLGGGPDVRLLSFGCATGEEVFSLRKHFPKASLKGLDVNPHNILVCNQRLAQNPDPKISFELADSVEREGAETYDAIFCMAVFRHSCLANERYVRCDSRIRFADFCRIVADIASRLKPGGLLFIIHANFRFCDTPTSDEFELMFRLDIPGCDVTPIFDRENRRTGEVNYGEVVFRKKLILSECAR